MGYLIAIGLAFFVIACAGWLITYRRYRLVKTELSRVEDITVEYDATKLVDLLQNGVRTLNELCSKSGMPRTVVKLFLEEAEKQGLIARK